MGVLTISRELGSEGDWIAEQLCQELGYERVDREILAHIAEQAGVDVEAVRAKERAFAKKSRLISGAMTSMRERDPTAFDKERSELADQTYAQVVRRSVQQYAEEGDVIIVGRGGQMILQDWPEVLHVHLWAPVEVRARRVAQRLQIGVQEAQRQIAASDEQKRQYIRHMHKRVDWKSLKYYHLVIDTGRVTPNAVVQMITRALKED